MQFNKNNTLLPKATKASLIKISKVLSPILPPQPSPSILTKSKHFQKAILFAQAIQGNIAEILKIKNAFSKLFSKKIIEIHNIVFNTKQQIRPTINVSQTSFSHISINSSTILMVSTATESPQKDLLVNASHVSRQSILAEILSRSTGNCHDLAKMAKSIFIFLFFFFSFIF